MNPAIKMKWMKGADRNVGLPSYETEGSAGMDLRANIEGRQVIVLNPGETALIPIGLRMEIPKGYEAQIRARSGLALKQSIAVLNSPGTVDSDYRGEIGVILHNAGRVTFIVKHGMRIAQMVVSPVVQAHIELSNRISDTSRGDGGFGSTGVQ